MDTYQIMPYHLHMIVEIADGSGVPFDHFVPYGNPHTQPVPLERKPLGNVIGAFKTVTTRGINVMRFARGTQIWQRKYYHDYSEQVIYRKECATDDEVVKKALVEFSLGT